MTAIAFITAATMPKPDLETGALVARMAQRGVAAVQLAWDADADWASYDLVLLRTPWDYVERLDAFLAWIGTVDRVTRLRNPASTIVWNAHKRYLLALQAAGVPVVETLLLRPADTPDLAAALAAFGDREMVAKPAIGIGAGGALRGAADAPAMRRHIGALLERGDVLVQPFLPAIETSGETSLIYIDGRYSHAVRKRPKAGDYRVQDHHGGSVSPHEASALERATAQRALEAAPDPTLYARIDLVEQGGRPVVMELELIEPELFLRFSESGTEAYLAAALAAAQDTRTTA
ncbi:MAG: RimK family alpha-L-glutamate ligase [Sphingobium sp.]